MGHETAAEIEIYCFKDPNRPSPEMLAHDGGGLPYSYTIECRAQPTGHSAYWHMTEWAKRELKMRTPLDENSARMLLGNLDQSNKLEQFLDLAKRSSLFWRPIAKGTVSSEIDPHCFSELWHVSLEDLLIRLASDKFHQDWIRAYLESSGRATKGLRPEIQDAVKATVSTTKDVPALKELYDLLRRAVDLFSIWSSNDSQLGRLALLRDCVAVSTARRAIECLISTKQDQKAVLEFLGSNAKPPQELPEAVRNAIDNLMKGLTNIDAVSSLEDSFRSTIDLQEKVPPDDQRRKRIRLVAKYFGELILKKNLELSQKFRKEGVSGPDPDPDPDPDDTTPIILKSNSGEQSVKETRQTGGSADHKNGIDSIVITGPIRVFFSQPPSSPDPGDRLVCIDVYGSQRTEQTLQLGPWPRAARIRNANPACDAKNDSDCVCYSESGVVIDREGIQIQAHDRALIARAFLLAKVGHARQMLNEQLARHDFWSRLCNEKVKDDSSTTHFDQMTAMFWELQSEH